MPPRNVPSRSSQPRPSKAPAPSSASLPLPDIAAPTYPKRTLPKFSKVKKGPEQTPGAGPSSVVNVTPSLQASPKPSHQANITTGNSDCSSAHKDARQAGQAFHDLVDSIVVPTPSQKTEKTSIRSSSSVQEKFSPHVRAGSSNAHAENRARPTPSSQRNLESVKKDHVKYDDVTNRFVVSSSSAPTASRYRARVSDRPRWNDEAVVHSTPTLDTVHRTFEHMDVDSPSFEGGSPGPRDEYLFVDYPHAAAAADRVLIQGRYSRHARRKYASARRWSCDVIPKMIKPFMVWSCSSHSGRIPVDPPAEPCTCASAGVHKVVVCVYFEREEVPIVVSIRLTDPQIRARRA